ncbi:bifunctional transcriptional activator/DNA repair enzyme AdaA [Paenibacillus thailandensis]|uniref:Bifunctional transcriptional activator/DNA repair enzyme AdaA n=1 Tax=Paenibacillus thailandensis TaxID=393250 RepID=A0ABW5R5Z9_9BACL
MKPSLELNDELWLAIVENNEAYNGKFFYGVETTGIFCRPSCVSRQPNRSHVKVFVSPGEALEAGFRPCKRCEPTAAALPEESWVDSAAFWLETHYAEALTLNVLAEAMHLSPYYLQRTFKRVKGVSPTEYLQEIRIKQAKRFLAESGGTVADIGLAVGMRNPAYFAAVFHKQTGMTPTEYRALAQKAKRKGDEPR